MPIMRSCLCWKSLRTGSTAVGIFSITVSFVQLYVQIAIWSSGYMAEIFVKKLPYILYVPLAGLDLLMIVFGIIMLAGLERGNKKRHLLLPWLVLAIAYILYEVAINIIFFYAMFPSALAMRDGNDVLTDRMKFAMFDSETNFLAILMVLVIYSGQKTIIYVLGILCVLSCYKDLSKRRSDHRSSLLPNSFDYPGGYMSSMTRNGRNNSNYPGPQAPGPGPAPAPFLPGYNTHDPRHNRYGSKAHEKEPMPMDDPKQRYHDLGYPHYMGDPYRRDPRPLFAQHGRYY